MNQSTIFETVLATVHDLYRAGGLDSETLQEFDDFCYPKAHGIKNTEMHALQTSYQRSQAKLASLLGLEAAAPCQSTMLSSQQTTTLKLVDITHEER